uniref:Uncharacterized protein n=1 Tax=Brassica campestris TaxID=3711 RepID=A0A3P5Y199_BRACM|nr:unnamed protein product [Brassica rapa]
MFLQLRSTNKILIPCLGVGTSPARIMRTMGCTFASHGLLVFSKKWSA